MGFQQSYTIALTDQNEAALVKTDIAMLAEHSQVIIEMRGGVRSCSPVYYSFTLKDCEFVLFAEALKQGEHKTDFILFQNSLKGYPLTDVLSGTYSGGDFILLKLVRTEKQKTTVYELLVYKAEFLALVEYLIKNTP